MNKTRHYLVALLLIGLIYISCENKIAVPPINPVITNKSDSTKAPFVYGPSLLYLDGNGNLATPYQPFSDQYDNVSYSGSILKIYYYTFFEGNGFSFSIEFHAVDTGVYVLSNRNTGNYTIQYLNVTLNTIAYYTDSVHTGRVALTLLDTINHVASGTFSYTSEEQSPIVNGGSRYDHGYFTDLRW